MTLTKPIGKGWKLYLLTDELCSFDSKADCDDGNDSGMFEPGDVVAIKGPLKFDGPIRAMNQHGETFYLALDYDSQAIPIKRVLGEVELVTERVNAHLAAELHFKKTSIRENVSKFRQVMES